MKSLRWSSVGVPAIIALLIFSTQVDAWGQTDEVEDKTRLIYSSGSADTVVHPDEVVFFVTIETKHLDIDSVMQDHERKLQKLNELIRQMNIRKEDVRMDDLVIEPDYLYRGNTETDFNPRAFGAGSDEPELQEYHGTRNLAITLHDLKKTTVFMVGLLRLDIELDRGPFFRVSNGDQLRQILTSRAIRDARTRADAIVRESGLRLGKPLRIEEGTWFDPSSYGYASKAYSQYGYSSAPNFDAALYPDMISLSIDVSITFEMFDDEE